METTVLKIKKMPSNTFKMYHKRVALGSITEWLHCIWRQYNITLPNVCPGNSVFGFFFGGISASSSPDLCFLSLPETSAVLAVLTGGADLCLEPLHELESDDVRQ